MHTNFDEMDLEPKSETAVNRKTSPLLADSVLTKEGKPFEEELQNQLLLRTVPLDDGSIGFVFTCTKNGPLATWRCHVCNFVDSWKNLHKHIDSSWHHDSMSKTQHSRSNFSKVENAIFDIFKGQPLPPGMEDEIAGPCQILKTIENYDHPLIGLEFLLELNIAELKEPRYLCLLCDKRGDPRSILVHLTSQSHYLLYLRRYFKGFYQLIDKLPKSNECRGNVSAVTSHLIAKIEERYGRLQPSATRDDVINVPEQRTIILQKIDNGVHFTENPEDKWMEDMLTVEYVQNTHLLLKKFPLKPKNVDREKGAEPTSKSLFNKSSKSGLSKKQLRNRSQDGKDRQKSPDVIIIGSKSNDRNSDVSPPRYRDHRPSRSPPDYRRRHSPPPYYHQRHRSRSPRSRHRSRTPPYYEKYRRSPPPHYMRGSSSRGSYRRRTPERYYRRSPSPDMRNVYSSKYQGRPKSPYRYKEKSPVYKYRNNSRSRSRSMPRVIPDAPADLKLGTHANPEVSSQNKSKERFEDKKKAFLHELKEVEESLNKDMDRYTDTPESHPAYQHEWKKFWSNRFKELQDEGKYDPHSYDYKPDWIAFWNGRVKELYRDDLGKRKKILKLKYGLSSEDEKPKTPAKTEASNASPPFEEGKKPVVDIKTMWKELTGFEIKEDTKKRLSPWELDNDDDEDVRSTGRRNASRERDPPPQLDEDAQPISPEPLSSISGSDRSRSPRRSRSRSRSHSRPRSRSDSRSRSRSPPTPTSYSKERLMMYEGMYSYRKPTKKIHFDNPLNIITVLRQLSVLEFQLGSYASHVISLLSSGLAMEKLKPQSSVDLLTKENVIFLELVKEKLKGQLLAGVVQKAMVKATLFCIKNIEELLLLVPKLKHTAPPPVPVPPPGLLYGAELAHHHGQPYGGHMYAGAYGMPGYRQPGPKHHYKKERFPFRKSPPKVGAMPDMRHAPPQYPTPHQHPPPYQHPPPERYPFSNSKTRYPFAEEKTPASTTPPAPAVAPAEEVAIDHIMVARQIAEVLMTQGRTDVSEEDLLTLTNTVVENLKQEQKNKTGTGQISGLAITKPIDMFFAEKMRTEANAFAPPPPSSTQLSSSFPPPAEEDILPAGFNLNEVSNSTLALLQDAFTNVSSATANPAKNLLIEELPESELIQLLRNFKSIPRPKQEKLIEYLRKLEDSNPERVEELKKYVNVL